MWMGIIMLWNGIHEKVKEQWVDFQWESSVGYTMVGRTNNYF